VSEAEARLALQRADALLTLSRWVEAERHARQALAAAPELADGHAVLTRALLGQGRHREAIAAAEAGLARQPDSEWLHRLRALALRRARRPRKALAAIDQALALMPDSAAAHDTRSLVLQDLKRLKAARAASAMAVELDPEVAAYHAHLGDTWLPANPATAEGHYRDSLALDPEAAAVHNNLGVALLKQKRQADAALAFKAAVKLDPRLAVAKENLFHAADPRRFVKGASIGAATVFAISRLGILAGRDGRVAVGGLTLVLLVGWLGYALWARREGIRRVAALDPQLPGLRAQIEKDRRRGWWRLRWGGRRPS
jgi:tetratricopeptide (TPR) repeat protein